MKLNATQKELILIGVLWLCCMAVFVWATSDRLPECYGGDVPRYCVD
jgi:hypothetical protein